MRGEGSESTSRCPKRWRLGIRWVCWDRLSHERRREAPLDQIKRKTPPVSYSGRRKNLVWVQPTLITEVEFRSWTQDGKLRHSSYKGLREVLDNAAVVFQILKAG
ncbi:hypothetical protein [Rhizobium sp. RHZ02]|uniref:ATP dependent DNA ligase n=1 Tax=Rhizobium sp. RHZ02 TaxID=2769306 RepID=UPI00391D0076